MEDDLRRLERRIDRHDERLNGQDSRMSAVGERVQIIERDVSALGGLRDTVVRLQAQWENFLKSDLPELNAKLDRLTASQEQSERSRIVEREEARKDRRTTIIALLSIAAILIAAVVPILLTSH